MPKVHAYGWVPDLPDPRDFKYSVPTPIPLPPAIDLRPLVPAIYDQGNLGSCTANAIAMAIMCEQAKQSLIRTFPSRLFIYYNERAMEGTVAVDSGAMLRDGMKSVNIQGACNETEWGYDISRFAVQPPPNCYADARKARVLVYYRVTPALRLMKQCLAQGFPWVFGISVFDSFESPQAAATGGIPMPDTSTEQLLGGHALLCVGYDDATQRFRFVNSWGGGWGQNGFGTIPYQYLADRDLADDFWTVRLIQGTPNTGAPLIS